jgi:hypothetical protein
LYLAITGLGAGLAWLLGLAFRVKDLEASRAESRANVSAIMVKLEAIHTTQIEMKAREAMRAELNISTHGTGQ